MFFQNIMAGQDSSTQTSIQSYSRTGQFNFIFPKIFQQDRTAQRTFFQTLQQYRTAQPDCLQVFVQAGKAQLNFFPFLSRGGSSNKFFIYSFNS